MKAKAKARLLGCVAGALLAVAAAGGTLLFLNSDLVKKDASSSAAESAAQESTAEVLPADTSISDSSADESVAEPEDSSEEETGPELVIELKTKDYAYTGEEITPKFTVKLDGETLDEDSFEMSLSNNKKIGKATLKVTSGDLTAKKTFRIVPPAPEVDPEFEGNDKSVTIKWEKVKKAGYYAVYRYTGKKDDKKKDEDEKEKPVLCANVASDELDYTDTDVESGTIYRYVVKACVDKDDKTYASAESKEIEAYTLPSKPGIPALTTDGKSLTWSAVAKCDGYEVLAAASGKEPKVYADTEKTTTKYSKKGIITVMVRAYIKVGEEKIYGQSSDPALIDQENFTPPEENTDPNENKHAVIGANISGSANINVANISQYPELPTGSEVTSLTMLLNFYGYDIDKLTLARDYLPKMDFYWKDGEMYGADYRTTIAGDPESESSYGCYAPCITATANKYISANGGTKKAVDISGTDFDTLLVNYIKNGKPVLIWITSNGLHETALTTVWKTEDGNAVRWVAYEHCVVLTGYDADAGVVYVSDPIAGNVSYSYSLARQRYFDMGKQAVKLDP